MANTVTFETQMRVRIRNASPLFKGEFGVICGVETFMRPPNNPLLRVRITDGAYTGLEPEISGSFVTVLDDNGVIEAPTRRTASSTSHRLLRH